MKTIAALAVFAIVGLRPALGVVTLGTSNQNFGLTGIGPNGSGQGQSRMSWGTCPFDGTNTTCTLSGLYTGLGTGGSYSFVITYAGNGPFPLNAVSQTPGSDLFFAQSTNNFSFAITLTQNNGPSLSFYSFANFSFFFGTASCTGVSASSCRVGQVGLTPNATITGPITGTFDPTPMITSPGAISAGGYGAFKSIAPATWIEIYGVNLATTRSQTWAAADFAGNQAPVALGGTTVTVGGKNAYVEFVSPGQVNVQVPSDVPTGSQQVVVTTGGGSSSAFTLNVNPVAPGLLAPASFILNGRQHAVALFSNTLTYVLPVTVAGVTTARARPGDNITLYGIGFGAVSPNLLAGQLVQQSNRLEADLKFTIGGAPATLTYAGLVAGNTGLYQFNIVVPDIPGNDAAPVAFTLGGTPGAQDLAIAIQK